jgi:hypothetical protein
MPSFGSSAQSSSDDQAAGNLVEVFAVGIATLYEKFEKTPAKKDEAMPGVGTPAGPGKAPAPVTPMGTPGPMTPAPTTPPKM